VVNGYSYRKIVHALSNISSGCVPTSVVYGNGVLVREDTTAGMVYYRYPAFGDTAERILYNYNLNIGDTLQYSASIADSVIAIDSVLMNGVYHKTFDFTSKAGRGSRTYTVIEGIGTSNHPVYPMFIGSCFEFTESLLCFRQNGFPPSVTIKRNGCFSGGGSFMNCSTIDVKSPGNTSHSMVISPNPATSQLSIAAAASLNAGHTISVYDAVGRCIYKGNSEPNKAAIMLNTSEWADGLYMVVVRDNSGASEKGMVMIQH
jgi:hypothetical protein